MKGLIRKDLYLLLQSKQHLLIMGICSIVMILSQGGSLGIGYTAIMIAILTVGTISYDEFDNGYPFLMSLPITRRTFVTEKYVFSCASGMVGLVLATVLGLLCTRFNANEYIRQGVTVLEAFAFLPVFLLIIAVTIPVQLKYGAEKSRLALALLGGGAFAIGLTASRVLGGADIQMPEMVMKLQQLSDTAALLIILLLSLLITTVSFLCSLHIMEHKQF